MKTSDFNYDLPEKLIANYPLDERSSSRLLVYSNEIDHKTFIDVINYFEEGDLLVVNNTSVIPARVYGNKESGGSVEVMLERIMDDNKALVQIRSGRSPKIGTIIHLDKFKTECIDRQYNFFILQRTTRKPLNYTAEKAFRGNKSIPTIRLYTCRIKPADPRPSDVYM